MNIEQVALVLAKAAAVDNRDVGRTAVLAWNEIIGPLEFADALAAVTRHRVESPGVYLEPGHVRRIAKLIRDERRAGETTKALPPGRFEEDKDRAERTRRNAGKVRHLLAELATKRSMPADDGTPKAPPTRSDTIHARALDRARAEKRSPQP